MSEAIHEVKVPGSLEYHIAQCIIRLEIVRKERGLTGSRGSRDCEIL